ncbi:hypothetical protein H9P43_000571 [Blastocladiella emersonii ATCC 22665]|nr:hypothetical protein H9P43_000571 [Blastocladiella emersonii ATCC 22665]
MNSRPQSVTQTPLPRYPAGIACVAIVGKQNNPLLVHAMSGHDVDLKFHFLSHVACDYVDEKLRSPTPPSDAYFGLLATIDGLNIYGYMTNTRIKFFIMLPTSVFTKDSELKSAFEVVHAAYIDLLTNPFYDPDSLQMVHSPRLIQRLQSLSAPPAAQAQ